MRIDTGLTDQRVFPPTSTFNPNERYGSEFYFSRGYKKRNALRVVRNIIRTFVPGRYMMYVKMRFFPPVGVLDYPGIYWEYDQIT